ncbi:MAG: hypothetical protein ACI4WW_04035 [Candidatus Coprovivens sp.]
MDETLLEEIIKDKYYDYLKENSYLIKELIRNPNNYKQFKEIIKEKYHLRISDKISSAIDDIDMISSIIDTL